MSAMRSPSSLPLSPVIFSGTSVSELTSDIMFNPGTEAAGENTDFSGKTCDALAHFCLVDSAMEFVPVDIQGRIL